MPQTLSQFPRERQAASLGAPGIRANLRLPMAQPPFSNRTNWNLSPNRLSQALARHRAEGKALLDLTVSNPTQCGFHYDQKAILRALSNPASIVYQPEPKGLETARRAVAEYYAARGDRVSLDDIFLTTSTSEAYSFVFRTLCN